MTDPKPIYQICFDCGKKHCHRERANAICSVWVGKCDICGKEAPVCPPYDHGGLKKNWDKETL